MEDFNGLLDFIKTPEGQGLLSMAFGGLAGAQRGAPLNSIGRAGLSGLMGYGNAIERQTQMEDAKQMRALREAQMANFQSEADTRKATMDAAKAKRDALPKIFMPATSGAPALNVDSYMPPELRTGMPPVPAVPAQPARLDLPLALKAGFTPDEIIKLDSLRNTDKDKVARTMKGIGKDGREYEYQVDEWGNKVGEGLPQWKADTQVDQGGGISFRDAYTHAPKASIAKTPTFSDLTSQGQLNLARERLNFDKSGGVEATKPVWNSDLGTYVTPRTMETSMPKDASGAPMVAQGKPMTEGQAAAYRYASRMRAAHDTMSEIEKTSGVDSPGLTKRLAEGAGGIFTDSLGSALGSATNFTQSADQQRVENAQRDFVTAVLRKESGAAISQSEFDSARKLYFPQVGDTAEQRLQKSQARERAIEGIQAEVPRSLSVPILKVPSAEQGDPNDRLGLFGRKK
jgi:hypothetical protein